MATDFIRNALRTRADQNVGLLAEFQNPGELYDAVKAVRKEGYSRIDTFTPFPIHGMDKAMGLGTSPLGWFVMIGGLTGVSLAMLMQWWMSDVDYPIAISGKPFFAFEFSTPVAFEVTILFAALTAVVGMLALNGLPKPYSPLFYSERLSRATDDGFFLQVAAADRQYDRGRTAELLRDLGALHIEYVDHSGAYDVAEGGALVRAGSASQTPPPRARS